jgi:hypothetical protein
MSQPSNAILLRSDLHDLFDSFLLGIEPTTLTVHFSSRIEDDMYLKFQDQELLPRTNGAPPLSDEALKLRWALFLSDEDHVKANESKY